MGARPSGCLCRDFECTKAEKGAIEDGDFDFDFECSSRQPVAIGRHPAGATFAETLVELSGLDQMFFGFCATSNLAAVRWLLHLGSHWSAHDTNGTTGLHVACRAGSIPVLKEILQYKELLAAQDGSGWTPLHIAVLMGRCDVVTWLLQAGAPAHVRNAQGQVAAELCVDSKTFQILRSFEAHAKIAPGRPWNFSHHRHVDHPFLTSFTHEPFFVPRNPVMQPGQHREIFREIGLSMLNRQPPCGLAFLVASGVVPDYPMSLVKLLRSSGVDTRLLGEFLGEEFSMCTTCRLELMNSVQFANTGVVSALVAAFRLLQLPNNLLKISRIVEVVAQIWWRQQEKLQFDNIENKPSQTKNHSSTNLKDSGSANRDADIADSAIEIVGLELKEYLSSPEALHQLMLSTIILHWHVHKTCAVSQKNMDFSMWRKINEGIEVGCSDVPWHVQLKIFNLVSQAYIPHLAVTNLAGDPARRESEGSHAGGKTIATSKVFSDTGSSQDTVSMLAPFAAAEGWAKVESTAQKHRGLGVKPSHKSGAARNMCTEVICSDASGGACNDGMFASSLTNIVQSFPVDAQGEHRVWLSLCCTLLFFSASPSAQAPYGFINLRSARIIQVLVEACAVTLTRRSSLREANADAKEGSSCCNTNTIGPHDPINFIMLLHDGRWQQLPLDSLELSFPSPAELSTWVAKLRLACDDQVESTHASQSSAPGPKVRAKVDDGNRLRRCSAPLAVKATPSPCKALKAIIAAPSPLRTRCKRDIPSGAAAGSNKDIASATMQQLNPYCTSLPQPCQVEI